MGDASGGDINLDVADRDKLINAQLAAIQLHFEELRKLTHRKVEEEKLDVELQQLQKERSLLEVAKQAVPSELTLAIADKRRKTSAFISARMKRLHPEGPVDDFDRWCEDYKDGLTKLQVVNVRLLEQAKGSGIAGRSRGRTAPAAALAIASSSSSSFSSLSAPSAHGHLTSMAAAALRSPLPSQRTSNFFDRYPAPASATSPRMLPADTRGTKRVFSTMAAGRSPSSTTTPQPFASIATVDSSTTSVVRHRGGDSSAAAAAATGATSNNSEGPHHHHRRAHGLRFSSLRGGGGSGLGEGQRAATLDRIRGICKASGAVLPDELTASVLDTVLQALGASMDRVMDTVETEARRTSCSLGQFLAFARSRYPDLTSSELLEVCGVASRPRKRQLRKWLRCRVKRTEKENELLVREGRKRALASQTALEESRALLLQAEGKRKRTRPGGGGDDDNNHGGAAHEQRIAEAQVLVANSMLSSMLGAPTKSFVARKAEAVAAASAAAPPARTEAGGRSSSSSSTSSSSSFPLSDTQSPLPLPPPAGLPLLAAVAVEDADSDNDADGDEDDDDFLVQTLLAGRDATVPSVEFSPENVLSAVMLCCQDNVRITHRLRRIQEIVNECEDPRQQTQQSTTMEQRLRQDETLKLLESTRRATFGRHFY